jgi:hypothetical protein
MQYDGDNHHYQSESLSTIRVTPLANNVGAYYLVQSSKATTIYANSFPNTISIER